MKNLNVSKFIFSTVCVCPERFQTLLERSEKFSFGLGKVFGYFAIRKGGKSEYGHCPNDVPPFLFVGQMKGVKVYGL